MTDSPFSDPSSASGINWEELNNRLLLFKINGVETGILTVHGAKDAVRADVVILDGERAGEEIGDTLVFPKVLQGQIKSKVGGMVLGRLGQGVAKAGQKPPWLLAEPTADDRAKGLDHLKKVEAAAAPPF